MTLYLFSVLKSLMVFFSIECFSYALIIKMCRVEAVTWCAYLVLVTCDAFKNDSAFPAEAIPTSANKLHHPDSSSQSPKCCFKWNLQSSTLIYNHQFSDDFRGNRSYLIRLNLRNIKSEIWRQSFMDWTKQYETEMRTRPKGWVFMRRNIYGTSWESYPELCCGKIFIQFLYDFYKHNQFYFIYNMISAHVYSAKYLPIFESNNLLYAKFHEALHEILYDNKKYPWDLKTSFGPIVHKGLTKP